MFLLQRKFSGNQLTGSGLTQHGQISVSTAMHSRAAQHKKKKTKKQDLIKASAENAKKASGKSSNVAKRVAESLATQDDNSLATRQASKLLWLKSHALIQACLLDIRLKYLGATLAESLDLGHIRSGVERPDVLAHLLHMAGNEDSPGEGTQPSSGQQTPQVTATTQQKLPQDHHLL